MFISDHKLNETRIKLDSIKAVHKISKAGKKLNKNMENEPFCYTNEDELLRKWYKWFWRETNKKFPRHQTELNDMTLDIDLLLISKKMTQNSKKGKKIILM